MAQIKLTTLEAHLMNEALGKLSEVKLPVKTAYWVVRMQSKLAPECDNIERVRTRMIKELGDAVGDQFKLIPGTDQHLEFTQRFSEVLKVPLELDLPQISIEQFGEVAVEPNILACLNKVVTD